MEGVCISRELGYFFILVLLRHIGQFVEWNDAYFDFLTELSDKILTVGRTIEGSPRRIHARAGMVPTDDQVVGSIVTANNGVPQRFARSGQTHRERHQRENDALRIVVA